MMMVLKNGALCFLLLAGMASALARPIDAGDAGVAMYATQFRQDRADRGGQQPRDRPNENRRGGAGPDYPAQPRDPAAYPGNQGAGHQGRMTPDERRALRRQIDEAGQDLYRRKH